MSEIPFVDPTPYVGLPPKPGFGDAEWFQAVEQFARVFAIRPGEKVLMLTDPLLDKRVVDAVSGIARARGATLTQYMAPSTSLPAVPDEAEPIIEKADFVGATWFCSIEDPFNVAMRKRGQRWVKITYFRDLDLLKTPQARFPIELVGEIIRATEKRFPKGRDFDLRFSDERGSNLVIGYTREMREAMFAGNRWRGRMFADEPGCYVHYLATHGPNFWDSTANGHDPQAKVRIEGLLYPQWAIGFAQPFVETIEFVFKDKHVTSVKGDSREAQILREMCLNSRLIEGGGCGFNPKAPRYTVYPAGSNAPGALHFGVDLPTPSNYIRKVMPNWEEPPVHQDLIVFDATVTAGENVLIDNGFLMALRDPAVVELAKRYGDPVELLEGTLA